MSGGARRSAARRRVHDATAGRIRIVVAIVAGGAFGALVVLWGGIGAPDSTSGVPSAGEVRCDSGSGCLPSPTSTAVPTAVPGATAKPSGRPSNTLPRTRPPTAAVEPSVPVADSGGPGASTSPEMSGSPGSEPSIGGSSRPPQGSAPSDPPGPSGSGPIDVIVDIPPILIPTCILHC